MKRSILLLVTLFLLPPGFSATHNEPESESDKNTADAEELVKNTAPKENFKDLSSEAQNKEQDRLAEGQKNLQKQIDELTKSEMTEKDRELYLQLSSALEDVNKAIAENGKIIQDRQVADKKYSDLEREVSDLKEQVRTLEKQNKVNEYSKLSDTDKISKLKELNTQRENEAKSGKGYKYSFGNSGNQVSGNSATDKEIQALRQAIGYHSSALDFNNSNGTVNRMWSDGKTYKAETINGIDYFDVGGSQGTTRTLADASQFYRDSNGNYFLKPGATGFQIQLDAQGNKVTRPFNVQPSAPVYTQYFNPPVSYTVAGSNGGFRSSPVSLGPVRNNNNNKNNNNKNNNNNRNNNRRR